MKRIAIGLVAGALALSACGGGSDSNSSKSTNSTKSTATTKAASPSSSASSTTTAAAATVKSGDTSLGKVAVDAGGKTLYLFANDQGTTSSVPANILTAWPPIKATGTPVAGPGIDAAKLGVAMQANNENWVTYNGHVVYTFSGDAAPGDTNGQGLANVWYVISAAGDKIG